MKYEGVICPACGEVFDKDSDVVVCPECGTPHHRACYEANNNCINAEHHSEEFVWINPNKPEKVEEKPKRKAESIDPAQINKESMPKNGVIGEMEMGPMGMPTPNYREIKGNEKIGDFTVDDYAKVIGKNVPKFMPRFLVFSKADKKVSWNWAAFFFGPFYLAYRKMYKYAALALLLIFIIPFICFNEVTEYYDATAELYADALTASAYTTSEEMEAAVADMEANMPAQPQCLVVSSYIEMGVDLVCGLFANFLYYKHCTKLLNKSKKFESLEKQDKYLKKHGGRSILSILVVVVGFYAIGVVIALAYYALGTDLATFLRRFIK